MSGMREKGAHGKARRARPVDRDWSTPPSLGAGPHAVAAQQLRPVSCEECGWEGQRRDLVSPKSGQHPDSSTYLGGDGPGFPVCPGCRSGDLR